MTSNTAVVFFIFNRPSHTQQVWDRIRAVKPENLVVVADGPRVGNVEDLSLVHRTRVQVERVDWPCNVQFHFSDKNLGLRERILSGLDFVFESFDRAIVLEDDCLADVSFFSFAEELLERYENDENVGMVCGSNFAPYQSQDSYHFSRSPYIWGWATWRRTWQQFRLSPQVEAWSREHQLEIEKTFSSKSQAKNFLAMMADAHKLNTWDISFAVWFRQREYLAIVPSQNLVENVGFGPDATHTKFQSFDVSIPATTLKVPLTHPAAIRWDARREAMMWRAKKLRWLSWPATHPVEFSMRVFRYLFS